MAKMTKAQARKRLMEANQKIVRVYMAEISGQSVAFDRAISNKDMEAITKILVKAAKRLR